MDHAKAARLAAKCMEIAGVLLVATGAGLLSGSVGIAAVVVGAWLVFAAMTAAL